MSLKILVNLFIEEQFANGSHLWIAKISAIKDGTEVKTAYLKGSSSIESIRDDIIGYFSRRPENSYLICNMGSALNCFNDSKYFTESKLGDTSELKNHNDYKEMLSFANNEAKMNLPKFIYSLPEDEFSKSILLFRIAMYFDENPTDVFEFPLYLKMKKDLDKDWEVEDLINDILEKSEHIYSL